MDLLARSETTTSWLSLPTIQCQICRLRAGLPAGVHVGTVDKFQGQQAPIVFFSMATSSGEDLPRDIKFLFSRNRPTSRSPARNALPTLSAHPAFLTPAATREEMKLVNALCRLAEYAQRKST